MARVTDKSRSCRAAGGRGLAHAALATAIALVVTGCTNNRVTHVRDWVVADPSARHPIHVGKKENHHAISVPRGSEGLNRRQAAETEAFVHDFKETGEGRLIVRAPSGSPNEVAAMRAISDVRDIVRRSGIRSRDVYFEPYFADGAPDAPIRISFARVVATPPECGHWPHDLGRDPRNLPYANFGCASQRNLAQMVADPRDFLGPRTMTPRSSERRDRVWDKYIEGETTVTKRDEKESGQVSEVSGGGE